MKQKLKYITGSSLIWLEEMNVIQIFTLGLWHD